jgi:hypothetical protein
MVTASATCTIRASASEAFAKFIDYRNWRSFMPAEFRPVSGPARPLKPGDRVRVRLDAGGIRLPVPVDVFSLDEPHEVVWGGGNLLLHARHRFVFENAADGTTLVRSDEDWTGLLVHIAPIARRLERQSEVVGRAQLEGFARWIDRVGVK